MILLITEISLAIDTLDLFQKAQFCQDFVDSSLVTLLANNCCCAMISRFNSQAVR